jgi:hypothetical protein
MESVLAGKEVLKMIDESDFNVLMLSLNLSHSVSDGIYLVLFLSMGGYLVKEASVFIPMLQPQNPRSLAPPHLFLEKKGINLFFLTFDQLHQIPIAILLIHHLQVLLSISNSLRNVPKLLLARRV